MPDPLPQPDLSGDVPRCRPSCSYASRSSQFSRFIDCDADHVQTEVGLTCLPYVRHLKLLSERRCDGCRDWDDGLCANGMYRERRKPGESCSRWEAKP